MDTRVPIKQVFRTIKHQWFLLFANGDYLLVHERDLLARLQHRGQRLVIPADVQPGWIGIPEDIPKPEPLLEGWISYCPAGSVMVEVADSCRPLRASDSRLALIHVWTDEAGVDHAEVIRP